MNIQNLFFILGIIFLFATIAYFSYEFIFNLAKEIKAAILVLLVIVSFFIGHYLMEHDM